MALPLPTGLTAVPPPDNVVYHNDLDTAFPGLGLPTVTTASTSHRGHHNTLGGSLRCYGIEDDAVEDLAGHVLTHNRLHVFANILTRVYGQQASYAQPAGSVSVASGTNCNQALLNAHPAGTKFWLQSGTHRPAAEVATMLVPKQGMEFHFAPGAILSGSVVLSSWTPDAGRWYATGQTQRGVDGPELYDGIAISPTDHPRAWKSETVYIDGVIQKHQNALADVGAGEWFFDYAANRIYIGTDPAGKTVETTMADRAIVGGGSGVKIVNGIVEKFMCPLQIGAVDNATQSGWEVIDTTVRRNHGLGAKIGEGGRIAGCKIDSNGQLGLGGGGVGLIVEDTEVVANNVMFINRGFEAGGSKWVFSTNAVVRRCWFHLNRGNGLWFDISNVNPWVYDNLSEANEWIGIFLEIGFGGLVEWNLTRGNGTDYTTFAPLGGGIVVNGTNNVEVRYNGVVDNRGGGVWGIRDARSGGPEGYELSGLNVHDNLVIMHSGLGGGTDPPGNGIQDFTAATPAVLPAANNRFQHNTYIVSSLSTTFWYWLGGPKTWSQWQAIPQDSTGTASEDTAAEVAAGTLIGWYDAQKQTGYAQGAQVDTMANFGGVAGPLQQTLGTSRPLWQSAAINGHPAIRLDGVDDAMWTASFGAVETQPNTIVMVVKLLSTTFGKVLVDGQRSHATNLHTIRIHDATGQWQIHAGTFVNSTGQTLNTTPHILRALFNGASSKLWIDEVEVVSGDVGAGSLGGITLGAWAFTLGDHLHADVGQLNVYAGDISASWATLRAHLQAKWSLV